MRIAGNKSCSNIPNRPTKRASLVVVLLVISAFTLGAGYKILGEPPSEHTKPPPPKLKDVKVWYYPPDGGKPITLIWWEPDVLHIDHRMTFSRRGKFRVRVEFEGGILKEGEVVNYVSISFRDDNSNLWDLPDSAKLTRLHVKDVYWKPPLRFVSGNIDVQVALWNDALPKTSLLTHVVDRTDFFILGRLEPLK